MERRLTHRWEFWVFVIVAAALAGIVAGLLNHYT